MNIHSTELLRNRWTLVGKKALITGATQGIGLAIAQEFLALGAEVMIVARNAEAVKQQLELWNQLGLPAHEVAADVTQSEDRQAIFDQVMQKMGGLDKVYPFV
ncbi:MAG: SDR family NAD(P)-dependent oxidoreductase [Oscillatoriophycideae cyanobacterium NC_groundwater_1537_Pr4_S-0.65um_50_18]|nr:SDR family NAD(P)-dependent oxidoreductase [Oscillatoriophycideae cyanobacterium NC_groundwater_1537_Pr4_S-0.65um_50_18]